MIQCKNYERILKEYFDLKDRETLMVLTSINEEDGSKVLSGLTGKLYELIINKVDDVDFGLIPSSKGDISKVDGIEKVVDALSTMVDIVVQCKQDPSTIQIVIDCINNIKNRTNTFTKAYALNLEIPILIYNTMVLAIISSTTYLIDTCVDFIKNPSNTSYEAIVKETNMNRAKDSLVIRNIVKFNESCKNGQLDKTLDYIIASKAKGFTGAGLAGGIAAVTIIGSLILCIIPIIRELIYLYFHARVSVSDYLSVQADLLQMNITNLEMNDSIEQEQRNKIIYKQTKIIEKLRKAANVIEIKEKKAENKTFTTINSENRTYRFNEIQDELPDSANSLF